MKTAVKSFLIVLLCFFGACRQKVSFTDKKTKFLDTVDWKKLHALDKEAAEAELLWESALYGRELGDVLRNSNIPLMPAFIDDDFLIRLKNLPPETTKIALISTGGLADKGLEAAEIVRSRGLEVVVLGSCNSACAEYILPAASKIQFFDDPFVGFHGNESSMMYFAVEDGLRNPCAPDSDQKNMLDKLEKLIDRKEALYNKTGHKKDFWKAQINTLGSAKLIKAPARGSGCVYIQKFPYELWYPTSEQLHSLLGLEFEGTLCADDPVCYERKIPLVKGLAEKYIVGDKEYISQLP